jgi:hypothetical protein
VTSVDDFISSISSNLFTPILTSPPGWGCLRCRTAALSPGAAPGWLTTEGVQPWGPGYKCFAQEAWQGCATAHFWGFRRTSFPRNVLWPLSSSTKEAMRELFPARMRFGSRRAAV